MQEVFRGPFCPKTAPGTHMGPLKIFYRCDSLDISSEQIALETFFDFNGATKRNTYFAFKRSLYTLRKYYHDITVHRDQIGGTI